MIKKCIICGAEFVAKRSTAKYCSNICRVTAQRGVPMKVDLEPPDVHISMTDDEVLEVITRGHQAADDFSRASMMTQYPLCLSLKKVGQKIAKALKEEGL